METAAEARGEIRCPVCCRLLLLRSGPKVAPHYAHRPRQSCRNRPGRTGRGPLRLEQLTLFELPPLEPLTIAALSDPGRPVRPAPRRRRRAWLPRLLRWIKGVRGPAPPRPSPLK